MEGTGFIRFCQQSVRSTKRNFWKVQKIDERRDLMELSRELNLAPVIVVRVLLSRKGFNRKMINQALQGRVALPPPLSSLIEYACKNDPVYSPKGLEYSKWRGEEGERILSIWLDRLGVQYERDLGRGLPDFVLKKPLKIRDNEVNWIESKASYGDEYEQHSDEKQFKRFDSYGKGIIVYWFGIDSQGNRLMMTGREILALVSDELKPKVEFLLGYVPAEFKHLLSTSFLRPQK